MKWKIKHRYHTKTVQLEIPNEITGNVFLYMHLVVSNIQTQQSQIDFSTFACSKTKDSKLWKLIDDLLKQKSAKFI